MDLDAVAALEAAWQGRVRVSSGDVFWDWAPADLAVFAGLLADAAPLCPPWRPFLEVGCGIGTKCLLAMDAGLPAVGIDRVPAYVAEARRLGVNAVLADARTWRGYGRAGIVYINHPLRDPAAEVQLERRIHDRMAPGAVLMAYNAGCWPDGWQRLGGDEATWTGVLRKPGEQA